MAVIRLSESNERQYKGYTIKFGKDGRCVILDKDFKVVKSDMQSDEADEWIDSVTSSFSEDIVLDNDNQDLINFIKEYYKIFFMGRTREDEYLRAIEDFLSKYNLGLGTSDLEGVKDLSESDLIEIAEFLCNAKRESFRWGWEELNKLEDEYEDNIRRRYIKEDTVKKSNGKWTNRGDDGTEHGEFKTKKQADAQRRAMYAQGYKGESLKETYYDGKAERYEIEDAYEKLGDLLEIMDDLEIESIQTDSNTYRIGIPYLQTRSGFIDLTNLYKYTDDSEEDYEYESLSESISVGDRVYCIDDDPETRISGVVEEIYDDGNALVSVFGLHTTVPVDKLISIDDEYESLKEGITEIRSKKVEDGDGFDTDYTMYKDDAGYFFMLGDKDFYPPERSYDDYECDTEDEANEWFDSYSSTGCYEDEYDYEYESITESEEDTNEDPLDLAQMSFESGHYFDRRDFGTDDDYEEYMSYIQLGPEGFYDEFRDELDFSQTFIDEYGDVGDFGYED